MREAHAHGRNSWGSVTRQWILNADIITRAKTKHVCVGKRAPRACGLAAAPWVCVPSSVSWQPALACSEGRVRLTSTCLSLHYGASKQSQLALSRELARHVASIETEQQLWGHEAALHCPGRASYQPLVLPWGWKGCPLVPFKPCKQQGLL